MGAYICIIEFKENLPVLKEIQSEFKKITGLELKVLGEMNITNLTSRNSEVINWLIKDQAKVESVKDQNISLASESIYGSHNERIVQYNHIARFYFYVDGFYLLNYTVKDNKIEMTYEIDQVYFPNALILAFYNLGGRGPKELVDKYKGKRLKKRKKLRYWEDYYWFNRPRK